MYLAAQHIRATCGDDSDLDGDGGFGFVRLLSKMKGAVISPFEESTVHEESGLSYGLDPCGYSVRIAQDLTIPAHGFALASTVERFIMPNWLAAEVKDKSSLARLGISMFNTHIDPGWEGYLTLEITNQRDWSQKLIKGQPIAQILFVPLIAATKQPYVGKYQDQPNRPVQSIKEKSK